MPRKEKTFYGAETSYHGNVNLKPIGHVHEYTKEEILEVQKCKSDPIYFIENYCKIIDLDGGLVPFKLWDFQRELIPEILDNRMVVLMMPRQQSKCIFGETIINIRRKNDGQIYKVKIGDFYAWQRFCREPEENQCTILQKSKRNNKSGQKRI